MSAATADLFGADESQPPVGTVVPPLPTPMAYPVVACPCCIADGPLYDGGCSSCWLRDLADEVPVRLRKILAESRDKARVIEMASTAGKEYVQRFLRSVASANGPAYANEMKEEIVAARRRRVEAG